MRERGPLCAEVSPKDVRERGPLCAEVYPGCDRCYIPSMVPGWCVQVLHTQHGTRVVYTGCTYPAWYPGGVYGVYITWYGTRVVYTGCT